MQRSKFARFHIYYSVHGIIMIRLDIFTNLILFSVINKKNHKKFKTDCKGQTPVKVGIKQHTYIHVYGCTCVYVYVCVSKYLRYCAISS